jgi:HAD superfamily hydrolase (TIGR01509 family)
MAKVRAIVFDFGGTLDQPGCHWLDRFARHYAACGLALDREQLRMAYDSATQAAYQAGAPIYDFGLERLLEFLVGLQIDYLRRTWPACSLTSGAQCCIGSNNDEELLHRIVSRFARESRAGMRRSREQLMALSRRFRLGMASNFYGNLEVVLAENGLLEFFDVVADSGRIGVFKPDPRIFKYVVQRLGFEPHEVAMVGDSLPQDCRPARELGMKAVWMVKSCRRAAVHLDETVDYVVQSITQVAQLAW